MDKADTLRLQRLKIYGDQPDMVERRRPGRREDASSDLVPLMRGGLDTPLSIEVKSRSEDQLGPIKGLLAGAILSGALWALVLMMVF